MDSALIWVIAGILLVLSELLATSIIAVFFGFSAIIVGLLLWAGIIESPEAQLVIFGVLSLVLLFTARAKLRRALVGDLADKDDSHHTFRENLGQRAVAVTDFSSGQGRIRLNGVQWLALAASGEEISSGDTVWIIANEGIQLTVSKAPPSHGS